MSIINLEQESMSKQTFFSPNENNLLAPPQVLIRAALFQMQKRVASVARSKAYDGLQVIVDKRNNLVCKSVFILIEK